MAVLIIDCYIGLFRTGFMQVLYLGRAPRIKETLPDFREECQVTRHSQVFRELTGSQRTPEVWGVTAWYQSLGIRIPREFGFGYPSPLGWFDVEYRYMKNLENEGLGLGHSRVRASPLGVVRCRV